MLFPATLSAKMINDAIPHATKKPTVISIFLDVIISPKTIIYHQLDIN